MFTIHTDGPHQTRLYGVHGLVQVVAVQAQTGLQTQRVSGAQTRGLHLWLSEEGAARGRKDGNQEIG
jgi:hypothetical protein